MDKIVDFEVENNRLKELNKEAVSIINYFFDMHGFDDETKQHAMIDWVQRFLLKCDEVPENQKCYGLDAYERAAVANSKVIELENEIEQLKKEKHDNGYIG